MYMRKGSVGLVDEGLKIFWISIVKLDPAIAEVVCVTVTILLEIEQVALPVFPLIYA